MEEILKGYSFSAVRYIEDDGSITLSLMEIDLIENGKNEQESRMALGEAILEYAMEYYENYALYIPIVLIENSIFRIFLKR